MDVAGFERTLTEHAPPGGLSELLTALWHERKGDWTRAHEIAQDIETPEAAWVHAYLHRREGDTSNAGYWYRQAGKSVNRGDMDEEWRSIVTALLGASRMDQQDLRAGLCATCVHARKVISSRGSTFSLCQRSLADPSYPRYPPLPVIRCTGHEPAPGAGA